MVMTNIWGSDSRRALWNHVACQSCRAAQSLQLQGSREPGEENVNRITEETEQSAMILFLIFILLFREILRLIHGALHFLNCPVQPQYRNVGLILIAVAIISNINNHIVLTKYSSDNACLLPDVQGFKHTPGSA